MYPTLQYRFKKTLTTKDNNKITRLIDTLIKNGWKATNGDHSIQQQVIDDGLDEVINEIHSILPLVYPLPRIPVSFERPVIEIVKVEEEMHIDTLNYIYTCIIKGATATYSLQNYDKGMQAAYLVDLSTEALIVGPPSSTRNGWEMFEVKEQIS